MSLSSSQNMGFTIPSKKVQPCLRSSRIFQHCTLIKLWRFSFCLSYIFQNFILTNRHCALPVALAQWSITNVPSAAANLDAQNEVKIYFKLALDMRWDTTGAGCREPAQLSAGSSRTAGRGKQDMGRWWPMTRTAPFNSVGAEEPAYSVEIPIVTTHKQHYRSFRHPFITAQWNKWISSFLTGMLSLSSVWHH